MSAFFRWLALLGAGLFLAGCASLTPPPTVAVSLIDVRPLDATVFETSAQLTLRIANESTQTLTLLGSSHRLSLNGSYVGRGVSDASVTVPPLGTGTITLRVYLENLALARKVRSFQERPVVNYEIDSLLHIAAGAGDRSLKATTTGTVDFTEFTRLVAPPR